MIYYSLLSTEKIGRYTAIHEILRAILHRSSKEADRTEDDRWFRPQPLDHPLKIQLMIQELKTNHAAIYGRAAFLLQICVQLLAQSHRMPCTVGFPLFLRKENRSEGGAQNYGMVSRHANSYLREAGVISSLDDHP